ncbi:MAG: hypothetical protein EA372_10160 [Chromatiaceae bacterium]|nr:MAG: hypothetical protein EA372_10160 [Chromatiaceae bacterium]
MSGASGFRRPGGGRFARRVLWLGVALAVSGVPVSVQGKSIPEVVDDMATLMEAITKFGPR